MGGPESGAYYYRDCIDDDCRPNRAGSTGRASGTATSVATTPGMWPVKPRDTWTGTSTAMRSGYADLRSASTAPGSYAATTGREPACCPAARVPMPRLTTARGAAGRRILPAALAVGIGGVEGVLGRGHRVVRGIEPVMPA